MKKNVILDFPLNMKTISNNPQLDISRLKYENENIKITLNQIIEEYADYRIETEEICKEYEETIQLLTASLEKYKSEITKLKNENDKVKIEQEKIQKELEKSHQKNKDKLKDIEILNNKIDVLQSKFSSINKKETTLKSKVVILETDNDHYLNKIHQYEEEVSDLKYNLENTIENLIMTQNDFEKYKNKKAEEIERLRLRLQEEKGNVRALMNRKNVSNHFRLKSSIQFKQNEDVDNLEETKIETAKRKLSWSEESNLRIKNKVKDKKKQNIDEINILEYDIDKIIELGKGRMSRSMTIRNSKYNFRDILSKMRKRKEELVIFNEKIKRDTAKFTLS